MNRGFTLPSPLLREFIDRYWFWESDENELSPLPDIYPATGTEIIFHYKIPFKEYPYAHILCSREKSKYLLKANGAIGFISVRFKSWAFPYFSDIPVENLKNLVLDVGDIWLERGQHIAEQIFLNNEFNKRVTILNNFFESLLIKSSKINPEIDWAINYTYYNYNNLHIDELIRETNLSKRSFQRKFKSSVGVSAKTFQKISRFQTILKNSLLDKTYPSLERILEAGYYDQAHFNKDFNSLTGKNPSEIISNKNFLAHFYNKSIR